MRTTTKHGTLLLYCFMMSVFLLFRSCSYLGFGYIRVWFIIITRSLVDY